MFTRLLPWFQIQLSFEETESVRSRIFSFKKGTSRVSPRSLNLLEKWFDFKLSLLKATVL
jgi:hypothetical protein